MYYGRVVTRFLITLDGRQSDCWRKWATQVWCVTGATLSSFGKSCGKRVIMMVNNDVIEYVCLKSCQ